MKYRVYEQNNKICLLFADRNFSSRTGIIFDLGHYLMDFSGWNMEKAKELFNYIVTLNTDMAYIESEIEYENKLYELVDAIDQLTPYFHFYSQLLISFIIEYDRNEFNLDLATETLEKSIPNSKSVLELCILEQKYYSKLEMRDFIFRKVINIIFDDIIKKREHIKQELDCLTELSGNKKISDLSSLHILFIIDYLRQKRGENPLYTNKATLMKLSPNKIVPKNLKTPDELLDFLIKRNIDIVETYEIQSIDELICFEIIKIFEKGLPIRVCKYCKQYFIPKGRIDSEYCERIVDGEGKPCSQIGAIKIYQQKYKDDPIHDAFSKAYKRFNARTQKKNMSRKEFFEWVENAKKWREMCYNGDIRLDEFNDLLGNKK